MSVIKSLGAMAIAMLIVWAWACATAPKPQPPQLFMPMLGHPSMWNQCIEICETQDKDAFGLLYQTPTAMPICVCTPRPI